MIEELILRNRSYRRFYQDEAITVETLKALVNLARLSASGANRQPLKYFLSADTERNAAIFECLGWAGYLKDWPGPKDGERPAAYIVVLGDSQVSQSFGVDHGIAAQSILLGATEQGLGGCTIASIQRDRLRQTLGLDPRYEILLVLALGKPKETVVVDPLGADGDIRYWRDERGVHHVPKR
ncbi:MAG: nitroreductase family protein, partial [Anaerolineae bacterium]